MKKMGNKEKIVVVGVSVFFGIGCLKVRRDRELFLGSLCSL
jgi:hypothetical protein